MKIDVDSAEASRRKLFLLSPVTASFASGPIAVLAALLLIDMGKTFGTDVGMTGQINTTCSIAAFTFALATSALSIRFKHKSLLLTGLVLMSMSRRTFTGLGWMQS